MSRHAPTHVYDAKARPALTIEDLDQDFPVSEPYTIKVAGKTMDICFRVITASDRKELHREAQLYISKDYAFREEFDLPAGKVSEWLDTGVGAESVIDEWWMRCVVAAAVVEIEGSPGHYGPAFDMLTARAVLTSEMTAILDGEAISHAKSFDPDSWDDKTFHEMLTDAKKKDSALLIRFGIANLAAFSTCLVSMLTDSQITKLSQRVSALLSQTKDG